MNENFLTVDEVAAYLKVTRQTVSKYIKGNELNAVKINKHYRIPNVALESFVQYRMNFKLPEAFDARKSRNCVLTYPDKTSELDVLTARAQGSPKLKESNHSGKYNSFYFGNNLETMRHLMPSLQGKVDLVYIDPPFGTGQTFTSQDRELAYSDATVDHDFLDFLRQRLILLRELLSPQGSIYLHIDKKIGHYVKIMMDEVFGHRNFINDITRIKCNPKNFARNAYGNYSDMMLYYAKERDQNIFNNLTEELTAEEAEKLFPKLHPEHGRYTTNPLHAPGETLNGDTGMEWKGMKPPAGRHWRYGRAELDRLEATGLIEWSSTGNPRKMVFLKDHKGKKIQDVWLYKDKGLSYVDYPTQKNEKLLNRIIANSSHPGSLVLDCFAGSGSTLLAAHRLGRKWIGMDSSEKSRKVVEKNFEKEGVSCNYYEVNSY